MLKKIGVEVHWTDSDEIVYHWQAVIFRECSFLHRQYSLRRKWELLRKEFYFSITSYFYSVWIPYVEPRQGTDSCGCCSPSSRAWSRDWSASRPARIGRTPSQSWFLSPHPALQDPLRAQDSWMTNSQYICWRHVEHVRWNYDEVQSTFSRFTSNFG